MCGIRWDIWVGGLGEFSWGEENSGALLLVLLACLLLLTLTVSLSTLVLVALLLSLWHCYTKAVLLPLTTAWSRLT